MSNPPPSDAAFTVSSLTRAIKSLLETSFGQIHIRGEISNLRHQQSGHIYFSLKDAGATITCVCFRGDASRLGIQLRNGLQVFGSGNLSLYEPRGNYQLILRSIELDGIGRLQQAFNELKAKLEAEGLFARDRKQPLPTLPRRIACITSESGAALQDFLSVLQRRKWQGHVIVIPVRVQGREAAGEISAAIAAANRLQLAELLVLCRGGGSLEDLWPFNEEVVARAVAASRIPTLSAVGHEIDFTLSDFAADLRAETPTAAAEWLCSSREQLLNRFLQSARQLNELTTRRLERQRYRLDLCTANLKRHHPRNQIENAHMRLDDLQNRLHKALESALRENRQQLRHLAQRFQSLRPETHLQHKRDTLRQLRIRLDNASHRSALKRGYAILRNHPGGPVIPDPMAIPANTPFTIEVKDGVIPARRAAPAD